MKALMILIVAAGVGDFGPREGAQVLQVEQIEFTSIDTCLRAAYRLTVAGRQTTNYQRVFGTATGTRAVLTPPPVITAECVQL